MPPNAQPETTRRRLSLRFQLLLSLNAAVVAILGCFMWWDSATEWRTHLYQKRGALQDEAETLLPAIILQRDDLERVQQYVDRVCGRMQEASSPGHHIAARIGEHVIQARAHHRASEKLYRAMEAAAADPSGVGASGDWRLVAGQASSGDVSVYVSEYFSHVEAVLRRKTLMRVLTLASVGAALVLIVNAIVHRQVTRPLRAIVRAVRELKSGELGAQAPMSRASELAFLAGEFNAMSSRLADTDRQRHREMARARQIQENLQPRIGPELDLPVVCAYRPAAEVGGDYFDVLPAQDDTFVLCIADVCGHGVPAAMGAAMLKILFTDAVNHTSDPGQVLRRVSAGFLVVSLDDTFASMVVAVVRRSDHAFRYASAGHGPVYLVHKEGDARGLRSTGPLLGVTEAAQWDTVDVAASEGDRLVLVTDGLTESEQVPGRFFGEDRLLRALSEARQRPLQALCPFVIEKVVEFCGPAPQNDDITVLAVEL